MKNKFYDRSEFNVEELKSKALNELINAGVTQGVECLFSTLEFLITNPKKKMVLEFFNDDFPGLDAGNKSIAFNPPRKGDVFGFSVTLDQIADKIEEAIDDMTDDDDGPFIEDGLACESALKRLQKVCLKLEKAVESFKKNEDEQ